MNKVLLVGGAGYIGSHCSLLLKEKGFETYIFDNLSTGSKELVFGELIHGDIRVRSQIKEAFAKHKFDLVLHFAAKTSVPDSIREPLDYYKTNVLGTINLLDVMKEFNCQNLVFSSTCAIYGNPKEGKPKTGESLEYHPETPYGETKAVIEKILQSDSFFNSVRFRYFNAAGASSTLKAGDYKPNKPHLIGAALQSLLKGTEIKVFGVDYETPDGSGVRDYIHVEDLAMAHYLAVQRLLKGGKGGFWNLGVGKGYSVLEVLDTIEEITGETLSRKIEPRREGDISWVYADNQKFVEDFGWAPKKTLKEIVRDAWEWEKTLLEKGLLEHNNSNKICFQNKTKEK